MRPYSLSFQRKCLNEFINSVIQKRIKAVTHSFPSFFLQSPINHLSLSLESRREMRQIETFFADKKTTNFIINKKHGFNKSVSCVRRRVGRVNIFIKFCGYWYYLLPDKYELSARLLLYTELYIQVAGVHKYSRGMNKPNKRTLRCVIRGMRKFCTPSAGRRVYG